VINLDTKDFKELSSEEYKKQTVANWTSAPCGSNYSQKDFLSKDYFDEIEKHRYESHRWVLENIKKFDIKGKRVLEIGFGMGTDHLNLARQSAIMHGIDLTPRNLEVTQTRFNIYGLHSELFTGDAENLPFSDDFFDFVYSFGVIHHSPDTEKIVSEIHRVLKPGGKCWITVYNKNSIFFYWSILCVEWLLHRGYKKETIKQRISRIEFPNDNPNLVIRLYKRTEMEKIFLNFSNVNSSIEHLVREDFFYIGKYIPESFLHWLAKQFGWYVIIEATK